MSIYQHFRPEEQPFVDQVAEWQRIVLDQYRIKVTDFLDPREQIILRSLSSPKDELEFHLWGGYKGMERTRAVLSPSYHEPVDDEFNIKCFQLDYPTKFVTVHHSDVLGALMNLGLERRKFGDILMNGSTIQLIVAGEVADYIRFNLTSIGKAKVTAREIEAKELQIPDDTWMETNGTVSSLRLDVVLAQAFRFSRSKIVPYITNKKVKVNWKTHEQTSLKLQEGDHISIRGLGRVKLVNINGQTKKGTWKVTIGTKKS